MTTQGVTVTTGNASMSKIFADTSTDDVWSGNVLTDTISNQSIGILQPNSTLTFAQAEYESGCMAWRLQNAQSLLVTARGWGVVAGQNCFASDQIPATRVSPNDILVAYPLPRAGPALTNSLAWVTTTKGVELMKCLASSDATFDNFTTAVNQQTLGDAFFNSQMRSISVQCEDSATLDSIQIVNGEGGVVYTAQGNVRGVEPASRSNHYNLDLTGLNIPIGKGFKLQIKTVSGV